MIYAFQSYSMKFHTCIVNFLYTFYNYINLYFLLRGVMKNLFLHDLLNYWKFVRLNDGRRKLLVRDFLIIKNFFSLQQSIISHF